MIRPGPLLTLFVALVVAPVAARAQSIGVTAGTPGIGLELGYQTGEVFGLRLTSGWFSIGRDIDTDNVAYEGKLKLKSLGLLADLFPFDSGLRVTGGGILNRNKIRLEATPTSNLSIGGTTYTPGQIGTIDGRIDFKKFSPYGGIGFTSNRDREGLSFLVDLGVMFQGSPRVALAATGPATMLPGFAANLERERDAIASEVKKFKYYPVAKVGLAYRF